jgi:anti-sigma regulatory factor (Ser/Thr protein kinase)
VSAAPVPWHRDLPDALPLDHEVRTSDQLDLPPDPRSSGLARNWVAAQLPPWANGLRDEVMLLTSELVTNAVIHARTDLVVGVASTDRDVVVGVHDLDLDQGRASGPERDGGRGLALVGHLASAWGQVHHVGGGKTVWFRMSL